jgi:hypothetical protein
MPPRRLQLLVVRSNPARVYIEWLLQIRKNKYSTPSANDTFQIYDFPKLDSEMIRLMVGHPFETRSDSFYFVDGKLVMHNKADYSYNGSEGNEWK